jgi:hypothetical protein
VGQKLITKPEFKNLSVLLASQVARLGEKWGQWGSDVQEWVKGYKRCLNGFR